MGHALWFSNLQVYLPKDLDWSDRLLQSSPNELQSGKQENKRDMEMSEWNRNFWSTLVEEKESEVINNHSSALSIRAVIAYIKSNIILGMG